MQPTRTARRPAFTLIEMLVVIAIIGVLGALTSVAVMRFIERQRWKNTEAQVKAVHEVFKRHWNSVIDDAKKEAIPGDVMTMAGGSPERAKILWIKLRLTEAFPMSFYEVQNSPRFYDYGGIINKNQWIDLIPQNRRKTAAYQNKISATSAPDRMTESSACLLVALSVARTGAQPLTADLVPIPLNDTDGDGYKELTDGWGRPLDFVRFPTANQDLQNANPASKDSSGVPTVGDPLDPVKLKPGTAAPYYFQLTDFNRWWDAKYGVRPIFQEVCRYSLVDPSNSSSPVPTNWYYTVPVILSRGSDGLSGVKTVETTPPGGAFPAVPPSPRPTWFSPLDFADMQVLVPTTEKDNIYSYKLAAPQ